jgi:Ca-activated chloride channel family protein
MTAPLVEIGARLGLPIDGFEQPIWLMLGAVLWAGGAWRAARRAPDAVPWPAWSEAAAAGARRDRSAWLPGILRASALALLAGAIAGPVTEHRAPPPPGDGLDLVLVLDASDSMRALDAQVDGAWRTRFELARSVVARFARERAAEGDRIALVVFGETAFTLSPLSSDGALLDAALTRAEPGMAGGATALGDALALAVKRVSPDTEQRRGAGPVAGRLVVLLTDGRSNAGAVPPAIAAALASARGVRVHTVGIGSTGDVAMDTPAAAGRGTRFERHDLDATTLAAIAEATGGRSFEAGTAAALQDVYAEIDALERVARRSPPRVRRRPHPEPWLASAGGLLALELLWARGLRRRIP